MEQTWHPLQLPSLGRYYEGKMPDGMVEITPWTTAQEEMIVHHAASKSEDTLIDKLLSQNVRYPAKFSYDELLLTDQHYLLMKLRSMSITCHYTVDHLCPNCGKEHEVSYDIDKLEVITPDENVEWNEPFEVELPMCGEVVKIRHLRIRDQKAIRNNKKRKEEAAALQDDTLLFTLARKVVEMDGIQNPPIKEVIGALRGLIKIDYDVLSTHAEAFETGIDESVVATCPRCKAEDKWALPLQTGFFRPKRVDIDAAIAMAKESRNRD